jgi:hypothetical protein
LRRLSPRSINRFGNIRFYGSCCRNVSIGGSNITRLQERLATPEQYDRVLRGELKDY